MPTTLHNGIELPNVWPPAGIQMDGTEPQTVPYLDRPPQVIDVRSEEHTSELQSLRHLVCLMNWTLLFRTNYGATLPNRGTQW